MREKDLLVVDLTSSRYPLRETRRLQETYRVTVKNPGNVQDEGDGDWKGIDRGEVRVQSLVTEGSLPKGLVGVTGKQIV